MLAGLWEWVARPKQQWLYSFFTEQSLTLHVVVLFGVGVCAGRLIVTLLPCLNLPESIWTSSPATRGIRTWLRHVPLAGGFFDPDGGGARRHASLAIELLTGLLFAALVAAIDPADLFGGCQFSPAESGSGDYIHWRIAFQLMLLTLLVAATIVDLELYLIPDEITVSGMILGVGMATFVGHIHLVPVWIDWNQEIAGLTGPYIPEWIKHHSHWHGFAWSMTGLAAGAGLTWGIRAVASFLIGREAMGLGDVTLMGMIGSFVGWQAIVFVAFLGPLCGLIVGMLVRLLSAKTFVPFGPYLSIAAAIVLMTWQRLWTPVRDLFGDWKWLLILAAGALAAFVLLLTMGRLYKSIPVRR